MVRTGWSVAVLVAAAGMAAGCQNGTAGTATTAPAGGAAGGGVLNVSATPAVWYTHDGAEQLYRQAKYADAEALCKQAVATIEKANGPKAPALAEPLIDLATVYMRLARYADAKAVMDRAEAVLDPNVPAQALLIARLGINKGWRLYTLGEPEAAEKVFADARALVEKHQEGESKDLAELINNQALMIEDQASEAEDGAAMLSRSRRMLIQAWQMRRKLTGEESPETAESVNNLGMHLLFHPQGVDDVELAFKTVEKALELAEKVYGPGNPETAMAHTNLAMANLLRQDQAAAERELKIAMPVTARTLGPKHPDRAYQLVVLGQILQQQTHYDEAEKAYTEALAINEGVYGKNSPNLVSTLTDLVDLYEAKGDAEKQSALQKRIEKLSDRGL